MGEKIERRLAAILAADMVGYSRLMETDEEGTIARQKAHRRELIDPEISEFGGRIVKTTGDGILAEFSSVVDAVSCAVAVQRTMADREPEVPEDRRIRYRIGINLGDIVIDGDDILGDGVNIAARLEGLSEPGGICVPHKVMQEVRNKLNVGFAFTGEQKIKNIETPVPVYRVLLDPAAAGTMTGERTGSQRPWRVFTAAAAVIAIAVVGASLWQLWAPSEETEPPETIASLSSDRPSIAVLPFDNISGDDSQDYFADGMTEDLITDLSKLDRLTVIARTSSFSFKGREVDIREVARALNATYVVEGSIRKVGEQVRINVQLIDAATGGHLWAERYDGTMGDIFGLQDKVLHQIVNSLALELTDEDQERLRSRGTDSVVAHDLYLRGRYQESSFSRQGYEEAMRLYEQALAIDPDYSQPYAQMSNILQLSTRNGWSDDIEADLRRAVDLAEKARALDPENPGIQWGLGRAYARLGTREALEKGIEAMKHAIELDPEFADAYAYLSVLYTASGRAEDGIRSVETAMRLNPDYPFWYLHMRGMARYVLKDFEAALEDFEEEAERSPTAQFPRFWLAATYAQLGRQDDAEWQVEEVQMMGFEGNIATIVETQPMQDPDYLAVYIDGLRKAGFED